MVTFMSRFGVVNSPEQTNTAFKSLGHRQPPNTKPQFGSNLTDFQDKTAQGRIRVQYEKNEKKIRALLDSTIVASKFATYTGLKLLEDIKNQPRNGYGEHRYIRIPTLLEEVGKDHKESMKQAVEELKTLGLVQVIKEFKRFFRDNSFLLITPLGEYALTAYKLPIIDTTPDNPSQ